MPQALRVGLAVLAVALLVCAGTLAATWSYVRVGVDMVTFATEESDWETLDTPGRFLDYLDAHRDQVSLVAYAVDETGSPLEGTRIAHRPDAPMVLASTMKIVVLSALARALDEGAEDVGSLVRLSGWDRWYVVGLDGGAHAAAYDRLGIGHDNGIAHDPARTVPLGDVARMMIEVSDNAATDLLIDRLGPLVEAEVQRIPGQTTIRPILPTMIHGLTDDDPCVSVPEPVEGPILHPPQATIIEQREMSHCLFARGTASSYAAIMAGVATGTHISPSASRFMAQQLEWPMTFEKNRERFEAFGTKGGSLPGILTEASYVHPVGGERWAVAVFANDMSGSAWFGAMERYVHQKFIAAIAEDPEFRARVAERFGG